MVRTLPATKRCHTALLQPRSRVLRAWAASLAAALIAACADGSTSPPGASSPETPDPSVLGGQSGGEPRPGTGPSADCACLSDFLQPDTIPVALRARILRVQGSCIELEVIVPLVEPAAVAAGDIVGGQWQELCAGSSSLGYQAGEEVLAVYEPGSQGAEGCPEYRSCSEQRCGLDPNSAGYDVCDASCVEDTRAACMARAGEARVGGAVRLAKLSGNLVSYDVDGQRETSTLEELSAPSCREDQLERAGALPMQTRSSARPAALTSPSAVQCPATSP